MEKRDGFIGTPERKNLVLIYNKWWILEKRIDVLAFDLK